MESATFGLKYEGIELEKWFGIHKVFREGPEVTSSDGLFAEFRACIALSIDPDIEFAKDRFTRMMNAGGVVADGAINAMRSHDMAEERRLAAEAERNKHK